MNVGDRVRILVSQVPGRNYPIPPGTIGVVTFVGLPIWCGKGPDRLQVLYKDHLAGCMPGDENLYADGWFFEESEVELLWTAPVMQDDGFTLEELELANEIIQTGCSR